MTSTNDGVFIRITGRLPRVASGVFDGPRRAAALESYDIRYLSFTYVRASVRTCVFVFGLGVWSCGGWGENGDGDGDGDVVL
jgi:hypothetical protein